MRPKIEFDLNLIKKYEKVKPPFYTTYPTGGEWSNDFNSDDYLRALEEALPQGREVPMALYVHIPFCAKLCYFCFCITIITNDRNKINSFTDYLFARLTCCASSSRKEHPSEGKGNPSRRRHLTHLTRPEFDAMIDKLKQLADVNHLDEFALEIDLVPCRKKTCRTISARINRISFGIQDFEPKVQKAINRIHSPELISSFITPDLRKCSVNFDLIYGLPQQTRESLKSTIQEEEDGAGPDLTLQL